MKNFLDILKYNKKLLSEPSNFDSQGFQKARFFVSNHLFGSASSDFLLDNYIKFNLMFCLADIQIEEGFYKDYIDYFTNFIVNKKNHTIYKNNLNNKEILTIIGDILNKNHKFRNTFYIDFKAIEKENNFSLLELENHLKFYHYNDLADLSTKHFQEIKHLFDNVEYDNYKTVMPLFILTSEGKILVFSNETYERKQKNSEDRSKNIQTLKFINHLIKDIEDKMNKKPNNNTELQISNLSSINKKTLIDINNKKIETLKNKKVQSIELIEKNINAQINKIQQKNELLFLKYEDYIKTDHWIKLRKFILKKYNDTCQKCNTKFEKKNLNIHHLNYSSLGEEKLSDLQLLCRNCHQKESSILEA